MSATITFDPARNHCTELLDLKGDKLGYISQPLMPPIGSQIAVPDGRNGQIHDIYVDLSNASGLGMVYITVSFGDN